MYYVYYVGRYVLLLILVYLYITVPAMVFYYDAIVLPLISALFSLFCLLPFGRHKIHIGREVKYTWADVRSEINPLYAAGFFRKSASDKNILSNLKGKFFCEVILCGIWIISCICRVYTLHMDKNVWKTCAYILCVGFTIVDIIWCYYALYYKWYYNEAFRYTESREHIWQPFSNIAEYSREWRLCTDFWYYHMPFEKIESEMQKSCIQRQYIWDAEYSKKDVKSAIYWKKTEKSVEILQLGQMPVYSEENMQILNKFFSDFWKKNQGIDKNKIKLIAILCIEKGNRELRNRLLSLGHVDQKDGAQGRYRLPVIILHSDEPQLQILPLYSKHRGTKEYEEMKKEICTLLDLSKNRPDE